MTKTSWFQSIPHGKLALLSIIASFLTVSLKFAAYRLTGSVGLLSDAVESVVNVVAAGTALFALWYAAQPADRSHPYGHEKIEFFSSGIEGGLIMVAAGSIAWAAIERLHHPAPLESIGYGVIVAMVATAINYAVAQALLATAKRVDSIVLEADGHHLMSDVWTSLGVVAGLGLAAATGLTWLDAVLALCVAVNIVRIGAALVRRSFDGLMDRALTDAEVQTIRDVIAQSIHPDMTYHALRTRRAGSHRFVDYHLLVPGHMAVCDAHDVEMDIEVAIEAAVPGTEVTAHIEPIEEPRSWNDSRLREED